jgi:dTDP-4-amino-4,6-dideoxygalactose transaminase
MTYVATANAFANAGWNLHFVDVDNHGLLDKRKLPELTSYDAVVLIGLYGASITHWGNERIFNEWNHADVAIVEDAAQHWLAADSVRLGLASAVSFDPMKNLACYGNGGAVLTQHRDLAEYARSWRDNGRANNHANSASNSRISELDCAQLLVKTKYIDQWQARRRKIANYWIERIESSSIRCLIDQTNAHDHAYHKFVIEVDNRDQLRNQLTDKKIETKVHYERPLHELDGIFRQYTGPGILSAASALARRALTLPLYPELTDLEVELDERGNVRATEKSYQSNIARVFTAGDMRRGQSLVVWAIKEGRDCAQKVDEFLMGQSLLETADRNAIARYL